MAGTTQYFGISYPTATDYVKDGASAMQTIATGFDSAVAIPTYNNQTGTTYTFVLADAGKTVTSDNASAVTFTIPPQSSVAWAANTTLTVRNLGAGVVTIAGGAGVTVTNTAQTVAQYGEVKLIRTASNAWTVVPASGGGASGLTLITKQDFTTASTIDVLGCFSSTYSNYLLKVNLTAASANEYGLMQFLSGSTPSTTEYYWSYYGLKSDNTTLNSVGSNQASTYVFNWNSSNLGATGFQLSVSNVNQARATNYFVDNEWSEPSTSNYISRRGGGVHNVATAYTGLRLITNAGTITGTVRIYGLQDA